MAAKQTENISFRMDKETRAMLDAIKEYKEMDSDSQAIRFLIKRYYRKKIEPQDNAKAPDGDVKGSNITIQGVGDILISHAMCKSCQHSAERTDVGSDEKILYCCKCAHDIDYDCNSMTCGRFRMKEV